MKQKKAHAYIPDKIKGKWNKNEYLILDEIGAGSIGVVYKAKDNEGNLKAVKISRDTISLSREFEIMKKIKHHNYLPTVYEIDDFQCGTSVYSFLVMEYIEGQNLKEIVKNYEIGIREILSIGLIILNVLQSTYKEGYFYRDIKLENIILDRKDKRIVLVDFGGVTRQNSNIREFTPTYNMKLWGMGDNKDSRMEIVFGTTMIIISMIFRREFNPLTSCIQDIIHKINLLEVNDSAKKIIIKGIKIKYNKVELFKRDLQQLITKKDLKASTNNKKIDYTDIIFATSIGIFLSILIIFFKLL